jgi:hypothetical protein
VETSAIAGLEGIGQLKISITTGIEPAIFWLIAN